MLMTLRRLLVRLSYGCKEALGSSVCETDDDAFSVDMNHPCNIVFPLPLELSSAPSLL